MAEEQAAEKRIAIGKIYLKDFSFESPQAPEVFRHPEWKPKTNLNISSSHTALSDNQHEIVLTISVEAKYEDQILFIGELQQAGLFELVGYDGEELSAIVGSFCPNTLFPYARETISTLITKAGFPEFLLQPINFDNLYAQSQKHRDETSAGENEKKH